MENKYFVELGELGSNVIMFEPEAIVRNLQEHIDSMIVYDPEDDGGEFEERVVPEYESIGEMVMYGSDVVKVSEEEPYADMNENLQVELSMCVPEVSQNLVEPEARFMEYVDSMIVYDPEVDGGEFEERVVSEVESIEEQVMYGLDVVKASEEESNADMDENLQAELSMYDTDVSQNLDESEPMFTEYVDDLVLYDQEGVEHEDFEVESHASGDEEGRKKGKDVKAVTKKKRAASSEDHEQRGNAGNASQKTNKKQKVNQEKDGRKGQKKTVDPEESLADAAGGTPQRNVLDMPRDMPVDPNEPTYCLCHQVSYGEMIGCDNLDCPIEWFHFACVGLTIKPKGKWCCSKCTQDRKKK